MASQLKVQPGLVAERIARLHAITTRNSNPSRWSYTSQQCEPLKSSASFISEQGSSGSTTALSSQTSRRSLICYVSNNALVGSVLRPKKSAALSTSASRAVTLNPSDSQSPSLSKGAADFGESPISTASASCDENHDPYGSSLKEIIEHDNGTCGNQDSPGERVTVQIDIVEPRFPKLNSARDETIVTQLEESIRRLDSPLNCGSKSDCKTAATESEEVSRGSRSDNLRAPNLPESRYCASDELHEPLNSMKCESVHEAPDPDTIKTKASTLHRFRSRLISLTRPERASIIPRDDTSGDASTERTRNERLPRSQKLEKRSYDPHRTLRVFSRSKSRSRTYSDTISASPGITTPDMRTLYASSRLDLKKCAASHENIEVKDDKGVCVIVLTVAGGDVKGPVRLEMNPLAQKTMNRKCEACNRSH